MLFLKCVTRCKELCFGSISGMVNSIDYFFYFIKQRKHWLIPVQFLALNNYRNIQMLNNLKNAYSMCSVLIIFVLFKFLFIANLVDNNFYLSI